jgi:hypothetical protein
MVTWTAYSRLLNSLSDFLFTRFTRMPSGIFPSDSCVRQGSLRRKRSTRAPFYQLLTRSMAAICGGSLVEGGETKLRTSSRCLLRLK